MRYITILVVCGLLAGCGPNPQQQKVRLQMALARLQAADSPEKKFNALGTAAKESFAAGKIDDAQKYAQELMALLPDFQKARDYGTWVSDANIVLGRVALSKGNVEDAKRYLLAAGHSPLTPYLSSNGPNMGLARDLLAKGEKQTVLEYFDLCRTFWLTGGPQLDTWSQQVKDGKVPEFGPSLNV